MENVFKWTLCFGAQFLALYAYWQFFFGCKDLFHANTSYSTPTLTVLQITCPNEKVAKSLSHGLVGKKLAACVNIIPNIWSVYSWNGTIEEHRETLMIVKTRKNYVSQIVQFVKQGHPYDIPEVISLDIHDGNMDYFNWVAGYVDGD